MTTDSYKGYIELQFKTDEELASFYEKNIIPDNLLVNEYLLIRDKENNIVDKYKFNGTKLIPITYQCLVSKTFGKIKPKDEIQELAVDALKSSDLIMLRGPAGTGKSYLALGYLFEALEKNKISKIIIFCNTVATAGSAKLGYYPGSREDKLLDSQVGNFLSSKLGSFTEVERLIETEQLLLLPMSDIRGYDTTGLNAGIYIQESQNFDVELLKLALQRIGDDCICIIDGDNTTQVDDNRFAGDRNGMKRMSEVFRGQDYYSEIELNKIYRSRIAERAQLM